MKINDIKFGTSYVWGRFDPDRSTMERAYRFDAEGIVQGKNGREISGTLHAPADYRWSSYYPPETPLVPQPWRCPARQLWAEWEPWTAERAALTAASETAAEAAINLGEALAAFGVDVVVRPFGSVVRVGSLTPEQASQLADAVSYHTLAAEVES